MSQPLQRRSICRECRREWVCRIGGLETHCPACGSQYVDQIEFVGWFDSTTPRDVIVTALASASEAQLQAEEDARRRCVHASTVVDPSPALLASER